MATIKDTTKIINNNPYIVFSALMLSIIGGILSIWEGLIKLIYNNTLNMDYLKQYFVEHWIGLTGLLCIILSILLFYTQMRRENKRLKSLEDFVLMRDKVNMEEEMLNAVAHWVNILNKTEVERDEYIRDRFPRNEKAIQDYLRKYYQNTPLGLH
jgi:hypothetical protein